jgi:hypothetical protein
MRLDVKALVIVRLFGDNPAAMRELKQARDSRP